MMINKNKQQLLDIIDRSPIVEILPSKEAFIEACLSKQLTFYIGFDPTNTALHLSHAKNFMLMEDFRKLGHKTNIVFGDFTACIGDPSDRNSARTPLTREQTRENAKLWQSQVKTLMDFEAKDNPPSVLFNSQWLDKLTIADFLELQSLTTVQRMLERDMFAKRIKEAKPVHLHEFSYPLFQAFDSVAQNCDVEVCGTDQTFNALMGRQFVKTIQGREKFCVIVDMMNHPKTGEVLFEKSSRKGVFLDDDANTMFGKVMSFCDEMIEPILKWCTRVDITEIKALELDKNPHFAKMFAAQKVVEIFFGVESGIEAKENFVKTFSKKDFPCDAPVILVEDVEITCFELAKLCLKDSSNSQIRRLISQNAVSINEIKQNNENKKIKLDTELKIKIGKLGFFKIRKK